MTPRERLFAALDGRLPDRVPIFTQVPFVVTPRGFEPGAFHGYADHDDWRARDPRYRGLVTRMGEVCDNFYVWRPPCMIWDQFFMPPRRVSAETYADVEGRTVTRFHLEYRGRTWTRTEAGTPSTGHTWEVEHLCKSPSEAIGLLEVPWEGFPAEAGDFGMLEGLLGERGLMWVTVPSPVLVVCRLFSPADFLVFYRTDAPVIRELMDEAARRIHVTLAALLDQGVGPIIRFGGAEHATPPMMSPDDFDRLVTAYDGPLVSLCKRRGRMVAYHCHGRISHALRRFAEMGVDQTDPVEARPDGDLDLTEARRISQGRITLTGNLQMREMSTSDPARVTDRVRRIIEEAGPRRLVVTTTGTPLEPMDERLERNYHAMIDAVLRYGAC